MKPWGPTGHLAFIITHHAVGTFSLPPPFLLVIHTTAYFETLPSTTHSAPSTPQHNYSYGFHGGERPMSSTTVRYRGPPPLRTRDASQTNPRMAGTHPHSSALPCCEKHVPQRGKKVPVKRGPLRPTNDFTIFNSFWFNFGALMRQGVELSPRYVHLFYLQKERTFWASNNDNNGSFQILLQKNHVQCKP